MFAFADRDVWVSIDGDLTSNWNVWNATSQLYELLGKRKARMSLLAPAVSTDGGGAKVGADDFLADYGTWADLLRQLAPGLPKQPKRADHEKIGECCPRGTFRLVARLAISSGAGRGAADAVWTGSAR